MAVLCGEARDATYAREDDLRYWAERAGEGRILVIHLSMINKIIRGISVCQIRNDNIYFFYSTYFAILQFKKRVTLEFDINICSSRASIKGII